MGPTFSVEFFDELAAHISRCTQSYRETRDRDRRKALLEELFVACDHAKVNWLLNVCDCFLHYDQCSEKEEFAGTNSSLLTPKPVTDSYAQCFFGWMAGSFTECLTLLKILKILEIYWNYFPPGNLLEICEISWKFSG